MSFLVTFLLIIASVIAFAWFTGETPTGELFDRNVLKNARGQYKQEQSIQNQPVQKNVTITINNSNGSITIVGHKHNNALIKVTKEGEKSAFKNVHARVQTTKTSIAIKTEYDNHYDHQNVAVHYHLTVPYNAVIESINNTNGAISIENITGNVNAKTANGTITATGIQNNATLHSVNGALFLTFNELPANHVVTAQTTNGAIQCTLPNNITTQLHAKTNVGKIATSFELQVDRKEFVGHEIKATLGTNPTSSIDLQTINGSITITEQ